MHLGLLTWELDGDSVLPQGWAGTGQSPQHCVLTSPSELEGAAMAVLEASPEKQTGEAPVTLPTQWH